MCSRVKPASFGFIMSVYVQWSAFNFVSLAVVKIISSWYMQQILGIKPVIDVTHCKPGVTAMEAFMKRKHFSNAANSRNLNSSYCTFLTVLYNVLSSGSVWKHTYDITHLVVTPLCKPWIQKFTWRKWGLFKAHYSTKVVLENRKFVTRCKMTPVIQLSG